MIRNYLRIAFRNMAKYKAISSINLFGLSVGIACCLLILTYILHEVSYDRYNSNADRIYRVTRSFNNKQGAVTLHLSSVAPPCGPLLQNEFPDIQKVTRILNIGSAPMRYEEKIFNEREIFFADKDLFNVFDVPLLKGNPQTALSEPYTIIITETVAKRYFGDADPIGKVVQMNSHINFRVTGVFKPFPDAAHLHPQVMLSFNTLKDSAIYGERNLETNWGNNAFHTYLLFPKNYPVRQVESRFPAFLKKYADNADTYSALHLQKLTDIHLMSHLDDELEENGDIHRVYIFSAIALFILLIACINYMNLSTARSALRAREIGIRKVSGARRGEIVLQFLSESILITALATLLALGLTYAVLPWMNSLIGRHLQFNSVLQTRWAIVLVLAPLIIGSLSGLYPALFMSAFQPAKVLKGLFKVGGGSISFRKVLVISQFAISIILIICTAIVFQQLRFVQHSNLGFDRDHVVTLGYNNALDSRFEAFRDELLQDTRVQGVTRSTRIPSGRLLDQDGAESESGDSLRPVDADIKYVGIDRDFVSTYHIPFSAGRDFSRNYATDSNAFLLNEAAVHSMGWKTSNDAIGRNFKYGNLRGKIIGVLSDFHFESMHQQIQPMVLFIFANPQSNYGFSNVSIKIAGKDIPGALAHLEKTWKTFVPQTPFEYSFLEEHFDDLYRSEQRQGTLFTIFSCIAIFIACLGLLGLSAFAISQRLKEIGVRKVLGASVSSIVRLLSADFIKLVAIAAILAFPIAWWAMHHWLMDFAYRISIQWWIFLAAGILAAIVALATISFQAIRAAVANPVKSLRSE